MNEDGKRPRFQFRLKSLLVVTLTLAVLFSVFGRVLRSYHRQHEAREALVALGGRVNAEPVASLNWLAPLYGEDFFCDVRDVTLNPQGGGITATWILDNRRFKSGQYDTPITDEDLKPLAALYSLERLSLESRSEISDAGIVYLAGADKLTDLNLAMTRVTDAGLARLTHLKNLENLDLFGTNVTDAGIKHLAKLSQLKRIDLRGTQVSDEGEQLLRQHLPGVEILRRPLDGPVRSSRLTIEQ